jgi:NitT/TauT family transport system permease protein
MRAHSATPWQTLVHLEVPAALPVLAAATKVGLTLAVIGAVVGEFVGADRGLGAAIQIARGQFNTPLMYAATLILVAISVTLYGVASAAGRRALRDRVPPA